MKKMFLFLLLAAGVINSQPYLGINYNNGDPSNSTSLDLVKKITFSNNDIVFLLTDNTSINKPMQDIRNIFFSSSSGDNPLPVELVSFIGKIRDDVIFLEWQTATEINNYGFEIQRKLTLEKITEEEWTIIGFVEGSGNSNSPKNYTYPDSDWKGNKITYRLKQIDTDGQYTYSQAITVNSGVPDKFSINQNYPNPFNPSTKIIYSIPNEGKVNIAVYDALGREVETLINEYQAGGEYEVIFQAASLPSGIYFCRLTSTGYTGLIKMILIK